MRSLFALLFLTAVSASFLVAEKGVPKVSKNENPAFAKVEDDPDLPRVLLIGDSISIGYTVAVREALKGKANVHRNPGNAGHTGMGVRNVTRYVAEENGEWDVIHFNWGLWDLCYRNPESRTQGNRDKVNGTLTHTTEQYAANLEKIVAELKKTGATLIFATTTPVPEGEAGRKVGDDEIYNRAALEVMKRHNIAVNDLHAVMEGKMSEYGTKPGDVHFTPEGSKILGEAVARKIEEVLEKN